MMCGSLDYMNIERNAYDGDLAFEVSGGFKGSSQTSIGVIP